MMENLRVLSSEFLCGGLQGWRTPASKSLSSLVPGSGKFWRMDLVSEHIAVLSLQGSLQDDPNCSLGMEKDLGIWPAPGNGAGILSSCIIPHAHLHSSWEQVIFSLTWGPHLGQLYLMWPLPTLLSLVRVFVDCLLLGFRFLCLILLGSSYCAFPLPVRGTTWLL